jgi:hypothetical protein
VLESLGFTCSEFDHALFIFNQMWGSSLVHCLLTMHVDDGLAGSNSEEFLSFIKSEISKHFGIKDLGPLKSFMGIQFERDHLAQEIWIHQEMYIDSLLAEHNLTSCNTVVIPLDPSFPLGHEEAVYPAIENLTHAFQHLIGSLLFLQLCALFAARHFVCGAVTLTVLLCTSSTSLCCCLSCSAVSQGDEVFSVAVWGHEERGAACWDGRCGLGR